MFYTCFNIVLIDLQFLVLCSWLFFSGLEDLQSIFSHFFGWLLILVFISYTLYWMYTYLDVWCFSDWIQKSIIAIELKLYNRIFKRNQLYLYKLCLGTLCTSSYVKTCINCQQINLSFYITESANMLSQLYLHWL